MTRIQHITATIELAAITTVARLAPWLAPIPTAWLVYDRTQRHLHWPWPVALTAAITLECLGLAILATTLQLYTYNRDRRKIDPAAPLLLPVALVGLYLIAAELLTVLLDVVPKLASGAPTTLADWAPAIFPLLSVAAMALLATRADHQRRLSQISADKAARSQARASSARSKAAASEPSPLKCPLCDRTFSSQPALNAHQRTHSRQKRDRAAFERNTPARSGSQSTASQ